MQALASGAVNRHAFPFGIFPALQCGFNFVCECLSGHSLTFGRSAHAIG
jgi:hypothetical protein